MAEKTKQKRDRSGRKVAEFAHTRCTRCGSVKTRCYSGPRVQGTVVVRRHQCKVCGRIFPSHQTKAEYEEHLAASRGVTAVAEDGAHTVPESGKPKGRPGKKVGRAPVAKK